MHIYNDLIEHTHVCALEHIFLEVGNSFITHFGFETMGGLPTTGRGSMHQTYTHSCRALESTKKYKEILEVPLSTWKKQDGLCMTSLYGFV